MKLAAFIFARGGSKGIPNKNLIDFFGKPLIGWAIEHALATPSLDTVYVSTDSHDIAEVARSFGAKIPFIRPRHLATDSSPELESWRHALVTLSQDLDEMPEAIVSVPTTAPLRHPEDIEACITKYHSTESDVVMTINESGRSPWFNMVQQNCDGTLSVVNSSNNTFSRRQDTPVVFDVTTVAYVASSAFVLRSDNLFDGKVSGVLVPKERSIDIDTPLDLIIARSIYEHYTEN